MVVKKFSIIVAPTGLFSGFRNPDSFSGSDCRACPEVGKRLKTSEETKEHERPYKQMITEWDNRNDDEGERQKPLCAAFRPYFFPFVKMA